MKNFKNNITEIFKVLVLIIKLIFPAISVICVLIGAQYDIMELNVIFGGILIIYLRNSINNFSPPRQ